MIIKTLALLILFSLSSCSSDIGSPSVTSNEDTEFLSVTANEDTGSSSVTSNEDTTSTELLILGKNEIQSEPDIDKLKEQYPEYFELSAFKGIEVYVWQMAENSYRCGMMSGTNRNKTDDEIHALQSKSLSIDEAKAILNEIGVKKEDIVVFPIAQPYSSYYYEIDDEYCERVNNLFNTNLSLKNSFVFKNF